MKALKFIAQVERLKLLGLRSADIAERLHSTRANVDQYARFIRLLRYGGAHWAAIRARKVKNG